LLKKILCKYASLSPFKMHTQQIKKVKRIRETLKPLSINWNPHVRQKNKREVGRDAIIEKKNKDDETLRRKKTRTSKQ